MFQEYTLSDDNKHATNITEVLMDVDSIELLMKNSQSYKKDAIHESIKAEIDGINPTEGSVKVRKAAKEKLEALTEELSKIDDVYKDKFSYSMRTKTGEPLEITEEVYIKLKDLCQMKREVITT